MLSIEITRECPLSCPGCYAYGDSHLGGEKKLTELSDLRGDALVAGVLGLVKKHRPLHVSLVGGEPMIRHRELSQILPALSQQNIFTMVVTSGIIPIPMEWMGLRRNRVAVSIDGLPEHHDPRRKPATYDRILENIRGRDVNIHWTITGPMMKRPGYLEEYLAFWQARPEVKRIWVSLYSPAAGRAHPGNAHHGRAADCSAGTAGPEGGLSEAADESRASGKRCWSRQRIRRNVSSRRCLRTSRLT